jgi:hypothetical protein
MPIFGNTGKACLTQLRNSDYPEIETGVSRLGGPNITAVIC